MVTQEDYEFAQQNPSFRQRFLDRIDLEDVGQYTKQVKYNPLAEEGEMIPTMRVRRSFGVRGGLIMPLNLGVIFKSTIEVYPSAFDRSFRPKLGDFLSVLIDHEGEHIRRGLTDPFLYIKASMILDEDEMIKLGMEEEIQIYQSQLTNVRKRNCSKRFIRGIEDRLNTYSGAIQFVDCVRPPHKLYKPYLSS